MSLRSLLNRRVDVVVTTTGVEDRYGNVARTVSATIADVPARRDQAAATEDVRDRDQQTRLFVYLLPLRGPDGTVLDLAGADRIVDGDDTLEIVGTPELIARRRRPHHWEATARLLEG